MNEYHANQYLATLISVLHVSNPKALKMSFVYYRAKFCVYAILDLLHKYYLSAPKHILLLRNSAELRLEKLSSV